RGYRAWLVPLGSVGPALRRVAGDGPHVGRHRDLQELEIPRGADLVVAKPARDVEGLAGLDVEGLAIFELEVDPTAAHVDELAFATVIVPAGGLRHAVCAGRDLGSDAAAARGGNAEVAVLEEGAPALDERRSGRGGVRELARRVHGCACVGPRCRVVHHGYP